MFKEQWKIFRDDWPSQRTSFLSAVCHLFFISRSIETVRQLKRTALKKGHGEKKFKKSITDSPHFK